MFKADHTVEGCQHCARIANANLGKLERVIWEREHSIAIVGDHQFFQGYGLVISKHHIREMHDLPPAVSAALFQDVLDLARAIDIAYRPWKINYASLGNVDEHLHWHVIPRYEVDPDKRDHPWKHSSIFSQYKTTPENAAVVKAAILKSIAGSGKSK